MNQNTVFQFSLKLILYALNEFFNSNILFNWIKYCKQNWYFYWIFLNSKVLSPWGNFHHYKQSYALLNTWKLLTMNQSVHWRFTYMYFKKTYWFTVWRRFQRMKILFNYVWRCTVCILRTMSTFYQNPPWSMGPKHRWQMVLSIHT